MRVHFHGAAGEVTGSLHEVHAAGRRVLLDCGMHQGSPEAERRNADPFPFEPSQLDALVISHAHIDHIGRVPLLVQRGFHGPIYAQGATADLMPIMLLDAASIAESEAERANRRRRNHEPEALPLYTREDVEAAMRTGEAVALRPAQQRRCPGIEHRLPRRRPYPRLVASSSCSPTSGSWCSPATSAQGTRRSCAISRPSIAPTSC